MTFTITYRSAEGALRTEAVDAANRAECLAQMRTRGIVPMSVKEGNFASRNGNGRPGSVIVRKGGRNAWAVRSTKTIPYVLLVIFVLLVGGGIGMWFWLHKSERLSDKPEVPKSTALPKEVTPATAPKPIIEPAVTNVSAETPKKPKTYIDEKGVERYMSGARVFDPKRPRREPIKVVREPPLFHSWAENQIATLLTLKPGTTLFGTRRFDNKFLQSFKQSLTQKIEFLDTDTEEQRQVKQAVIEAKEELAAAMNRGEDVCEIMKESYSELQRLAEYKRDLEKRLREIASNPEMTGEDITFVIGEANKLLASKGIAPIKGTPLLRRNMKLSMSRTAEESKPKTITEDNKK